MNEEKTYSVYIHTSPSGKYYVGITKLMVEKRWRGGKGYSNNPYFTRAIKKYGWDNFKHEVVSSGLTKEEAENLEIKLIAELHSNEKKYGYNISSGGNARNGTKHSEESKEKMREARKNNPHTLTEEGRRKIIETHKGNSYNLNRRMSEETKKKISEAISGEKHPLYGTSRPKEVREKISKANRGRILTDEHKQKISDSLKGEKHPLYGKSHSEETRNKISEAKKGTPSNMKNKKHTEESKEKMREAKKGMYEGEKHPKAKKVYCDGKIFGCIKDCALFYNVNYVAMRCWLNGTRKIPKEWEEKGLKYII